MDQNNQNQSRRYPRSAGIFLLLGPIIGTGVGIAYSKITHGMVIGAAIGVLLVALFWLFDRK